MFGNSILDYIGIDKYAGYEPYDEGLTLEDVFLMGYLKAAEDLMGPEDLDYGLYGDDVGGLYDDFVDIDPEILDLIEQAYEEGVMDTVAELVGY